MIAENHSRERYVIASGKGRIRPRARLIRTIGAELISSEVVAVLELVRNSYDADARSVEIRFKNPHRREEAALTILDDGHGMTRDTFLGPWLEPATGHKSSQGKGAFSGERSPKGRRRLGSKGVGRFAAQRLGEHLLARSRSKGSQGEFEAEFDWNLLDNGDTYLEDLVIPWREVQPERARWHGTALHIGKLRESWTEERFERLRLALSRLLGPGLGDEFKIYLTIEDSKEEIKPFIDSLSAMYSLEGHVRENGACEILYRDITGAEESWQRSVLWPLREACGPFSFRVSSWDLDREALDYFFRQADIDTGLREFRRSIRDHSGISLYRDGFRILPYGEPDNDWLRLDRRRVNNPTLRLSNNQILGWVRLTADDNPLLQDQTNREGLVTNQAFTHLQQAILEVITYLEVRRFSARRSFLTNRTLSNTSQPIQVRVDERLEDLVTKIAQDTNGSSNLIPELRETIRRRVEADLTSKQAYLRLASVGSFVPLVISNLQYPLKQALSETTFIQGEIDSVKMSLETKEDILASLEKLNTSLQSLQENVEHAARMAASPAISWARTHLSDCIEVVGDLFLGEFVRAGIDFKVYIEDDLLILVPPTIVQQAVALLFDNAVFWLRQARSSRRLTVLVKPFSVVVENNGVAIPSDLAEKIFEYSFTTREGANGLGLTVARDLLRSIGGDVKLLKRTKGAAFEVRVPDFTKSGRL